MEMDSIWGVVGIFVIFCGLYALYSFVKMKMSGEIQATLILGKECTEDRCRDKEAFVKKVSPAVLVFGLVTTVYGIVDLIHCYVMPMAIVDTCGMAIFFIVLIWFAVYTTRLKKEYFRLY